MGEILSREIIIYEERAMENQILVIFGASGDLATRKLYPALFKLYKSESLPKKFAIVGVSRTDYDDESFRIKQGNSLREKYPQATPDCINGFMEMVYYKQLDTAKDEDYLGLKDYLQELRKTLDIDDNLLFYLSTPPVLYKIISGNIHYAGLNSSEDGFRRILIEKPFGVDLESAIDLNTYLKEIFKEKDIYRIDHYLGKETVQNILVLRFSNGIFEPLWNRNYIDSVDIIASETIGVENRGGYYDNAGALRDMIQNHLMHLMAFVAMEAPSVFEPESIRDEIVKVFRSVRPFTKEEIDRNIKRGQYEGYREENGVRSDSNTETYVSMRVNIDNWRWSGVPIYLTTGKKMHEKVSTITIRFKGTPHQIFGKQKGVRSCNKLVIRIQPDESISLTFGLKKPGAGFEVNEVGMNFSYASIGEEYLPGAYERLLLDVINGDSTLYSRSDAVEASWTIMDAILERWKEKGGEGMKYYNETVIEL